MKREPVLKIVEEQKKKGMTKSYERVLIYLNSIADNTARIELD